MRVFVTGGTGYIGAHIVCRLLRDDNDVTVLSRHPSNISFFADNPRVTTIIGDIRECASYRDRLSSHDAVVHAAIHWEDNDDEHGEIDQTCSRELFEAAGEVGVDRLLYISSTAVHRPFQPVMNEESPISPIDDYGKSKAKSEQALRDVASRSHMHCNCVRLAPTVGKPALINAGFKTDRRFTEFLAAARAGEDITVIKNDGRQFIGVEGAADICCAVLQSEHRGETYIAADGHLMTWEHIANGIISMTKSKSKVLVKDTGLPVRPFWFDCQKAATQIGSFPGTTPPFRQHLEYLVAL